VAAAREEIVRFAEIDKDPNPRRHLARSSRGLARQAPLAEI